MDPLSFIMHIYRVKCNNHFKIGIFYVREPNKKLGQRKGVAKKSK